MHRYEHIHTPRCMQACTYTSDMYTCAQSCMYTIAQRHTHTPEGPHTRICWESGHAAAVGHSRPAARPSRSRRCPEAGCLPQTGCHPFGSLALPLPLPAARTEPCASRTVVKGCEACFPMGSLAHSQASGLTSHGSRRPLGSEKGSPLIGRPHWLQEIGALDSFMGLILEMIPPNLIANV